MTDEATPAEFHAAREPLEITPEMIAAGVSVLLATPSFYHSDEERVEAVYRAMNERTPAA